MTTDELLAKARRALSEAQDLRALLDTSPCFVKGRPEVKRARALSLLSDELVLELVRRLRDDVEVKTGSEN